MYGIIGGITGYIFIVFLICLFSYWGKKSEEILRNKNSKISIVKINVIQSEEMDQHTSKSEEAGKISENSIAPNDQNRLSAIPLFV